MDKFRRIVELLDGNGQCLVRNDSRNTWYVHCWMDNAPRETIEEKHSADIFNRYVADCELEKVLDEIIEKLGGK